MTNNQSLIALELNGTDAGSFLQGYVTCDMDELMADVALPMAFPDRSGRVIASGWVYGSNETVNVVIHHSTESILRNHLKPYLQFSKSKFQATSVEIAIEHKTKENAIQLKAMDAGLYSRNQSDSECFETLISLDIALVTEATSGKFLPQMLNLTDLGAVSFSKGCYLGQEVIARAQHRGQVKRRIRKYTVKHGQVIAGQLVKGEDSGSGVVVLATAGESLVVVSSTTQTISSETAELHLAA